ncbi:MAG: glycosyltransferase [Bacillota bacterium]
MINSGQTQPENQGAAPKLSLCMIVKNEEEYLPRCLNSVRDVVDQMVIVDTGSTDRTVEIARSFGAEVYHHPWHNDFSEARNVSLDHATGDWIIILDADEELVEEDKNKIKPLLASANCEGFFVVETNFAGDLPGSDAICHPNLRIFRNRKQYRYHGALHEQVINIEGKRYLSQIRLNHYGYLNKPLSDKNKLARNLDILLKEVEENPNNSFVHFNLANEYTRTKEYEKALFHYQKAFKNLASLELQFASYLVRNIVRTLNEMGRYQDALKVITDAVTAYPTYTDLFYLKGLVYLNMKRHSDAIAAFQRCLQIGESEKTFVTQVGTGSFLAYFGMGAAYEQIGDLPHAVDAYAKALKFSNKRIFGVALNALGSLLLSQEEPHKVKAYLEKYIDTKLEDNLLALSAVFSQYRHFDLALAYVDQAEKLRGESSGRLLYARGEYLLSLGRFSEASECLAKVPAHSEYYPVAALTGGLSQLFQSNYKDAESLFEKVAQDEAYRVAAEAYRIFSLTIRGSMPQESPFTERAEKQWFAQISWGLLTRLLELREFERFEKALPVLRLAGLEPMEISLALGTLYYRLGFYDSAVEELLKLATNDAKETGVYNMLAEICLKREMPEEATAFLYRSLELDDKRFATYPALATALCQLQRYDEAAGALQQGLKQYPTSEVLRETLRSVELMSKTRQTSGVQAGR